MAAMVCGMWRRYQKSGAPKKTVHVKTCAKGLTMVSCEVLPTPGNRDYHSLCTTSKGRIVWGGTASSTIATAKKKAEAKMKSMLK